MKNVCQNLGGHFDYESQCKRLMQIEQALQDPSIWDQVQSLRVLNQERSQISVCVENLKQLTQQCAEAQELLALADEAKDTATTPLIASDLAQLEKKIGEWEFKRLFSGEMDSHSAYLEIQAGSGGTDAQDWAEMLLRLYLRWGERHGFRTQLISISSGEGAGIKGVTLHLQGEYAYGWLRTETGVHRLVRLSPFDANHRRHTSFAAVFVSPEIDDQIAIDISPADLRIDTYRASGAGGQHVQKTDSAVRITHLPTNTVVQSQNDRSQHRNRDQAMRQLRAKLFELEVRKRKAQQQARQSEKRDIGWGSQIRSYIVDDARVKDLRTGEETGRVQAVFDGDIDLFLRASLAQGL